MFMNEPKMFDTDIADSSDGPRSPILFYLFSSKENGAKEAKTSLENKARIIEVRKKLDFVKLIHFILF